MDFEPGDILLITHATRSWYAVVDWVHGTDVRIKWILGLGLDPYEEEPISDVLIFGSHLNGLGECEVRKVGRTWMR